MKETTPQERRDIAVEVNAKTGKGNRAKWINEPEQIVEQFKEYVYQESLAKSEEYDDRRARMLASLTADLSAAQLEYHMPALIFLFRRYLAQR